MKEYIVQAIAQETIDSFDALNAPELIRCKDCKYFPSAPQHEPSCWKNRRYGDDPGWFCADGERR